MKPGKDRGYPECANTEERQFYFRQVLRQGYNWDEAAEQLEREWIEGGWEKDTTNTEAWADFLVWRKANNIKFKEELAEPIEVEVVSDAIPEDLSEEAGWVNAIVPGLRGERAFIRKDPQGGGPEVRIPALDKLDRSKRTGGDQEVQISEDVSILPPDLSGVEVWVDVPGLGIHYLSADAMGGINIRYTNPNFSDPLLPTSVPEPTVTPKTDAAKPANSRGSIKYLRPTYPSGITTRVQKQRYRRFMERYPELSPEAILELMNKPLPWAYPSGIETRVQRQRYRRFMERYPELSPEAILKLMKPEAPPTIDDSGTDLRGDSVAVNMRVIRNVVDTV